MIWTDITLEVYQSELILSVRVFNSDLYNIQKFWIGHSDWQKTIFVWHFDFANLTLFKNTAIIDYNSSSLCIPGNLFILWKLKQFFESPSLKDFRS
jgi:hypothetical protein